MFIAILTPFCADRGEPVDKRGDIGRELDVDVYVIVYGHRQTWIVIVIRVIDNGLFILTVDNDDGRRIVQLFIDELRNVE